LKLGQGTLFALDNYGKLTVHSTERACPRCGRSFEPLDPKVFSYNSAQGWCPTCRGFGELFYLPDVDRGARADAIEESWFGWQEGEREICPDCNGARLNSVQSSKNKVQSLYRPLILSRSRQWKKRSSFSAR
jgi:excinuclease ABC subunit A